jgi:hypothetical protein
MRVYLNADYKTALRMIEVGICKQDERSAGLQGLEPVGVRVADRRIDINECTPGEVILCMEVPAELFSKTEIIDEMQGYRESFIPWKDLDELERPKVYDCVFGFEAPEHVSRAELVKAKKLWEDEGHPEHAKTIDNAIKFFDEIGWQTPLALRDPAAR